LTLTQVFAFQRLFTQAGRDYESTMLFLIRNKGELRIEHDRHRCGLFAEARIRALLAEVGFEVRYEDYHPAPEALGHPGPGGEESFPMFVAWKKF